MKIRYGDSKYVDVWYFNLVTIVFQNGTRAEKKKKQVARSEISCNELRNKIDVTKDGLQVVASTLHVALAQIVWTNKFESGGN